MSVEPRSPQKIVASLTEVIDGLLDPPHTADDRYKIAAIAASMTTDGWQGAPLVRDGDAAITGSHRLAAAAYCWNTDGIHIPVPAVGVADLCAAYGLDWAAIRAEHVDWRDAARSVHDRLPADVAEYLGLDLG